MLETQQERLDKEADTATGEGWVRPCRDRTAHMGHYWPEGYCYGVTEAGERRTRFRSRYREHWAPVTRDDADYDGGLSTMHGMFR